LSVVPDLGLALLAQSAGFEGGLGSLVWRIGLFGKLVLLVLAFFMASAVGLIVERVLYLRRVRAESERFLAVFRKSGRFSEVKTACGELRSSPLVGLFLAGSSELTYQLRPGSSGGGEDPPRNTVRSMEAISRSLQRAAAVEVAKLERGVPFLATTASVTPFIGLLGTVVGIMNAFIDIGVRGSAGLAVVAPGIAEALINTAAGLFAAIPAVMGYNFLVTQIKRRAAEMDDFSLEFISISERNFGD
jgi:biopolymer transport protein TolQ